MRVLISLVTALATGATALVLATPVSSAPVPETRAPTTDLQPQRLERGPDIALPHLDGKTVVDGDVRIAVRSAGNVTLLGKLVAGYVVGTQDAESRRPRIWRVAPDATRTILLRGHHATEAELSDDGSLLVAVKGYRPTTVTLVDTENARILGSRRFPGSVSALDGHRNRVVLGSDRGTQVWNWKRDRVRTLTRRWGYRADLSADRLASYTSDPYLGGCTRISPVTRPGHTLWRSCRERVDTFSPDGRRMATIHILADGLGPNEVWQRKVRGRLLARYTTTWFGLIHWERPRTLLLEVNGRRKAATVRCRIARCENATDPVPVTHP